MYKLTTKEEQVMSCFWERGALFVREIVELHPDPKPHFNTVSTVVRSLEERGFLSHTAFGATYQYYPIVSADQFRNSKLSGLVHKYFDNSYLGVVSSLIREEKIPVEELKRLIEEIER